MTNNVNQIRASIDSMFPERPKRPPPKINTAMVEAAKDKRDRFYRVEDARLDKETGEVWD